MSYLTNGCDNSLSQRSEIQSLNDEDTWIDLIQQILQMQIGKCFQAFSMRISHPSYFRYTVLEDSVLEN